MKLCSVLERIISVGLKSNANNHYAPYVLFTPNSFFVLPHQHWILFISRLFSRHTDSGYENRTDFDTAKNWNDETKIYPWTTKNAIPPRENGIFKIYGDSIAADRTNDILPPRFTPGTWTEAFHGDAAEQCCIDVFNGIHVKGCQSAAGHRSNRHTVHRTFFPM